MNGICEKVENIIERVEITYILHVHMRSRLCALIAKNSITNYSTQQLFYILTECL